MRWWWWCLWLWAGRVTVNAQWGRGPSRPENVVLREVEFSDGSDKDLRLSWDPIENWGGEAGRYQASCLVKYLDGTAEARNHRFIPVHQTHVDVDPVSTDNLRSVNCYARGLNAGNYSGDWKQARRDLPAKYFRHDESSSSGASNPQQTFTRDDEWILDSNGEWIRNPNYVRPATHTVASSNLGSQPLSTAGWRQTGNVNGRIDSGGDWEWLEWADGAGASDWRANQAFDPDTAIDVDRSQEHILVGGNYIANPLYQPSAAPSTAWSPSGKVNGRIDSEGDWEWLEWSDGHGGSDWRINDAFDPNTAVTVDKSQEHILVGGNYIPNPLYDSSFVPISTGWSPSGNVKGRIDSGGDWEWLEWRDGSGGSDWRVNDDFDADSAVEVDRGQEYILVNGKRVVNPLYDASLALATRKPIVVSSIAPIINTADAQIWDGNLGRFVANPHYVAPVTAAPSLPHLIEDGRGWLIPNPVYSGPITGDVNAAGEPRFFQDADGSLRLNPQYEGNFDSNNEPRYFQDVKGRYQLRPNPAFDGGDRDAAGHPRFILGPDGVYRLNPDFAGSFDDDGRAYYVRDGNGYWARNPDFGAEREVIVADGGGSLAAAPFVAQPRPIHHPCHRDKVVEDVYLEGRRLEVDLLDGYGACTDGGNRLEAWVRGNSQGEPVLLETSAPLEAGQRHYSLPLDRRLDSDVGTVGLRMGNFSSEEAVGRRRVGTVAGTGTGVGVGGVVDGARRVVPVAAEEEASVVAPFRADVGSVAGGGGGGWTTTATALLLIGLAVAALLILLLAGAACFARRSGVEHSGRVSDSDSSDAEAAVVNHRHNAKIKTRAHPVHNSHVKTTTKLQTPHSTVKTSPSHYTATSTTVEGPNTVKVSTPDYSTKSKTKTSTTIHAPHVHSQHDSKKKQVLVKGAESPLEVRVDEGRGLEGKATSEEPTPIPDSIHSDSDYDRGRIVERRSPPPFQRRHPTRDSGTDAMPLEKSYRPVRPTSDSGTDADGEGVGILRRGTPLRDSATDAAPVGYFVRPQDKLTTPEPDYSDDPLYSSPKPRVHGSPYQSTTVVEPVPRIIERRTLEPDMSVETGTPAGVVEAGDPDAPGLYSPIRIRPNGPAQVLYLDGKPISSDGQVPEVEVGEVGGEPRPYIRAKHPTMEPKLPEERRPEDAIHQPTQPYFDQKHPTYDGRLPEEDPRPYLHSDPIPYFNKKHPTEGFDPESGPYGGRNPGPAEPRRSPSESSLPNDLISYSRPRPGRFPPTAHFEDEQPSMRLRGMISALRDKASHKLTPTQDDQDQ